MGLAATFCFFTLIAGLLLLMAFAEYHRIEILRERGVRMDATVTHLQHTIEKGSDLYSVSYAYAPPGPENYGKIEAQRLIPVEEFQRLQIGSPIPVIYDPRRIDWNLPAFTYDHDATDPARGLVRFGPFAAIPFFIGLLLCVGFYVSYERQKKLLRWGQSAPAKIVGERDYNLKGPVADVTYEFTDSENVRRTGVAKMLPTKTDTRPTFIEYRERRLADPIVLFLPADSRRSGLYPFSMAEAEKPEGPVR